ncbi:hypothetical protein AWV79_01515 [Cupriavidus sp. UYMMa02A]|nr:hypothetical protein AWV79_01515 [Cupriavidus sp. UYMMa02A]
MLFLVFDLVGFLASGAEASVRSLRVLLFAPWLYGSNLSPVLAPSEYGSNFWPDLAPWVYGSNFLPPVCAWAATAAVPSASAIAVATNLFMISPESCLVMPP